MEWMQNRHTEQAEEKSLIKTNLFVNTAIEKLQRESHVDIPSTFWRWENTVKQRRWHVRQNTTRRPFVRRAHTHTHEQKMRTKTDEKESRSERAKTLHIYHSKHILWWPTAGKSHFYGLAWLHVICIFPIAWTPRTRCARTKKTLRASMGIFRWLRLIGKIKHTNISLVFAHKFVSAACLPNAQTMALWRWIRNEPNRIMLAHCATV